MTTPFSLLVSLAGLSQREAGDFLGVRIDTVKSWSSGRNRCPDGALAELRALFVKQAQTAQETLAEIERLEIGYGSPDAIELGEPVDDDDARSIGWPCVGAWRGMAARVVAGTDRPVEIVPRGSTPATRAAARR